MCWNQQHGLARAESWERNPFPNPRPVTSHLSSTLAMGVGWAGRAGSLKSSRYCHHSGLLFFRKIWLSNLEQHTAACGSLVELVARSEQPEALKVRDLCCRGGRHKVAESSVTETGHFSPSQRGCIFELISEFESVALFLPTSAVWGVADSKDGMTRALGRG